MALASQSRLRSRRAAFTMAEMLVVMAIITILAASLAVVIPRLRTRAMMARASADIQSLGTALEKYRGDIGHYPVAPWQINTSSTSTPNWVATNAVGCNVLFEGLTNRNAGGENRGWGGASLEQPFIHGTLKECSGSGCTRQVGDNIRHYTYTSKPKHQILDPWGVPYYYIAYPDYLRGVKIWEGSSAQPVIFGTTERPNDFWGDGSPGAGPGVDPKTPRKNYYGPPLALDEFFNASSFQIHTKGPDQLTDAEDGNPGQIDACDRGTDRDDRNNFGQ